MIVIFFFSQLDENHQKVREDNFSKVNTKKRVLRRKIHDYVHSFTVHGLTRIITGNKIEKLIWTTVLVAALFGLISVTRIYIDKFLSYSIYTEVHSVMTQKAHHPAITFCLSNFLDSYKGFYCGWPMFTAAICPRNRSQYHGLLPRINRRGALWSNGIFHFKSCRANTFCATPKHIISSDFGACVTWNYDGSLFQLYNRVTMKFEINEEVFTRFQHQPLIDVIVHQHGLPGRFLNPQMVIKPGEENYLQIRKSEIKRLKTPYPSNCTDKYFYGIAGRYNRRICTILDFDINLYKKCGDIRDFTWPYIPEEIREVYMKPVNFSNIYYCFMQQNIEDNLADCPLPCQETNYDVYGYTYPLPSHQVDGVKRKLVYSLNVGYQTVDHYQVMEEKALYTWDQLASEFGGLCGLVVGASILSIVELVFYFVLVISYKLA